MLDVGTGSGAVALALKDERPDLLVSGSDISDAALDAGARERAAPGLDVSWLQADLLDGVPDEFDAVLANPPYVADSERAGLAPEILRHEPAGALFAGAGRARRDRGAARRSSRGAARAAWWRSRSAPVRPARSCELRARRRGFGGGAR